MELPSQHYFVGKLNRESHDTKGFIDAQIESSYEFRPNKNAKGYKLTHKGVVKNTNFDKGQMDLHVDVVLDLVGKTLVVDGIIKAATQGVKESREATVRLSLWICVLIVILTRCSSRLKCLVRYYQKWPRLP